MRVRNGKISAKMPKPGELTPSFPNDLFDEGVSRGCN
jgi:hypothetical protein